LVPLFVVLTREELGERYPWVLTLTILVAVLIVVRHRTNWIRIARGREQAIWENRPESPDTGAHPMEGSRAQKVEGSGEEKPSDGEPSIPEPTVTPGPAAAPESEEVSEPHPKTEGEGAAAEGDEAVSPPPTRGKKKATSKKTGNSTRASKPKKTARAAKRTRTTSGTRKGKGGA